MGEPRTLAIFGARIYTLDPAVPRAEALFARDGRILLVGGDAEVGALAAAHPGCVRLELGGRCVLPGFTDSHIHLLAYGLGLSRVALSGVTSLQTVLERVGEAAREAPRGAWVEGWGWDHSLWAERRFPSKSLLDGVAPQVPVALRRKDGHMTWLNSAALAAAGITARTPDPQGGRIGRDAAGEPDGLLFERAQDLVTRAIPAPAPAQAEAALLQAAAELHRLGVTGVHIPEGPLTFHAMQALDAAGRLGLRTTMMLAYDTFEQALAVGLRTGFGSERLKVGPLKLFMDGSLGSETAAMLEPFEGSADNYGLLTLGEAEVRQAVRRAAGAGVACAIHAIGDRANRIVLDAFEETRPLWEPAGLRQRIEHVQVLHPHDLPRLAGLGVIASVQPIHATQDMLLVDRLWGSRGRYAYAFRSLLQRGTRLAFGSDAPVETPDPLAGLYAAVARRRADGQPPGGWYPEERISIADAVRAYTSGAAYAAGDEHHGGTLAAGKWADFVVLSEDIMQGPPESIVAARVTHTVFDGRVVYRQA
jgi:predicted amidohydrolase YtcJ